MNYDENGQEIPAPADLSRLGNLMASRQLMSATGTKRGASRARPPVDYDEEPDAGYGNESMYRQAMREANVRPEPISDLDRPQPMADEFREPEGGYEIAALTQGRYTPESPAGPMPVAQPTRQRQPLREAMRPPQSDERGLSELVAAQGGGRVEKEDLSRLQLHDELIENSNLPPAIKESFKQQKILNKNPASAATRLNEQSLAVARKLMGVSDGYREPEDIPAVVEQPRPKPIPRPVINEAVAAVAGEADVAGKLGINKEQLAVLIKFLKPKVEKWAVDAIKQYLLSK